MRIHSLTLTGIGPFRSRQQIDFDAITASGLFLIEGPTGAGKTTIIDAIVFALYGGLSGEDSDPGRLRSQFCDLDEPSEVVLEFSVAGVRHTITRNPAYERRKSRGEGTTTERARQTLVVHDDVTPAMREAAEIGAYLIGRIGLTADQFRRLVVLPQGEFDTLLRASPTERYKTLAGLIDDGAMERVQDLLLDRAKAAAQTRESAQRTIDDLATLLCGRAGEVLDDVPDASQLTAAQVGALQSRLDSAADAAHAEASAAATSADSAATHAMTTAAAHDRALQDAVARERLQQARSLLPDPLREADPAALREHLSAASASIALLAPWADWESALNQRRQQRALLDEDLQRAASTVSDLQAKIDRLPEVRRDLDRLRRDADAAAARLDESRREVARLTGTTETVEMLRGAEESLTAARDLQRQRQAALDSARTLAIEAREHRVHLLERRLAHSAAELAEHLQAGEACPVCGSCDHPRTATGPESGLVRDSEIDAAETAVSAATTTETEARRAADEVAAAVLAATSQADHLRGQLAGINLTDLPGAIAAARHRVLAAQEAAEESERLSTRLRELDVHAAQWAGERDAAVAAAARARATAQAHDEREASAQTQFDALVPAGSTAAAQRDRATSLSRTLESVLAAQESVTGQAGDIDLAQLKGRADEAQAVRLAADQRNATAQGELTRLSTARDAIRDLARRWTEAFASVESVIASTEPAIRLGDLVSARSNANIRKLTLQAYAVQQRFAAILAAASRHVERMSSGKYSFALDESASGSSRAGLGIDMVDAWTGQVRDPSSLSGGETFYSSLALALGLADIVREESGGVTLETLFVDEGFGSLDADTLTVVLDQLDALRARGRTVGVISHVAEMKEWVHDRIEVVPGLRPGEGSRIRQTA